MKRRGYFRHFNTATEGDSIQEALAEKHPYAVILFWFLCEKCNQKKSERITLSVGLLSRRMHLRADKVIKEAKRLKKYFNIDVQEHSTLNQRTEEELKDKSKTLIETLEFFVPNYAKLQQSRNAIIDDRLKMKDEKIIETTKVVSSAQAELIVQPKRQPAKQKRQEIARFDSCKSMFESLPEKTINRWRALYEGNEEWVKREIVKAWGWTEDNTDRKPKSVRGWCNFISRWLERGWSSKGKTSQSSSSTTNKVVKFSNLTEEEEAENKRWEEEMRLKEQGS